MSSKQTFPQTGLVRLSSILAPAGPIPISKSTWWQGVRDGRFPQPKKLGPRTDHARRLQDGGIFGGVVFDK